MSFHSFKKIILPSLVFILLFSIPKEASALGIPFIDLPNFGVMDLVTSALALVVDVVVKGLMGIFVLIAGYALDLSIYLSITNFKDVIEIEGIQNAWRIVRDVSNVGFIFILLYIGISTILQIPGVDYKKLLPKVLAAALLVNFSGLITRTVIDVSNVVTYEIYEQIWPEDGSVFTGGMGIRFITSVDLIESVTAPENEEELNSGLGITAIIAGAVGQIIRLQITGFVLLLIAFLFISRMLIFIVLYILSPLAIFSIASGKNGNFNKWLSTLTSQAIFAPVMMFFLLLVLVIGESGSIASLTESTVEDLAGAIGGGTIGTIILFVLINGLLIASVLVARTLSKETAGFTTSISGNLAGRGGSFALRNTAGRFASRAGRSERFQAWAGRSFVGRQALKGTRRLGSASYDFRSAPGVAGTMGNLGNTKSTQGGFESRLQQQIKSREEFGKSLDKSKEGRKAFANKLATGPFNFTSKAGSKNAFTQSFGRRDRVAASTILQDNLKETLNEIKEKEREVNRLRNLERNRGGLTDPQNIRLFILENDTNALQTLDPGNSALSNLAQSNPPIMKGSVADLEKQRSELESQIKDLGLTDTHKNKY